MELTWFVLIEIFFNAQTEFQIFIHRFVLLAVSSLLVISACLVGICICVCRRRTGHAGHPINSMQCEWLSIFYKPKKFIQPKLTKVLIINQFVKSIRNYCNCCLRPPLQPPKKIVQIFKPKSAPNNWIEWLIETSAWHITTSNNAADVGKLASPCGTISRVPPHNTQITDGHSPSHMVPGKLRQLGPDLSQTTTQKDEWFV